MATPPRPDLFSPLPAQPSERRDSLSGALRPRESRYGSGYAHSESRALEQSLLATRLLGADERPSGYGAQPGQPARSSYPNRQEMFVDTAPAVALQQQFQRQRPEFIAIHEVGSAWARKLLISIATASGRKLQQLDIRQEGSGAPLATVEYIECPATDGGVLRIFSTTLVSGPLSAAAPGDPGRQQIALVLLAYARLGVLMVGDMSVPAMRAAFAPLQRAMQVGPWPSRQLLLLPLTSAGALASIGSDLFEDTGVTVRTTPQATRSSDAWSFISGTWNRLREELRQRGGGFGGQSVLLPALPGARVAAPNRPPVPSTTSDGHPETGPESAAEPSAAVLVSATDPISSTAPITSASQATVAPMQAPTARLVDGGAPDPTALGRFIEGVSALNGMLACCVFPLPSGQEMGDVSWPDLPFFVREGRHPGDTPTAGTLTTQGRLWWRAIRAGAQALGLDAGAVKATMTLDDTHLVLRPVPRRADLVLLAVFARNDNPMLFELQLSRLEREFGVE